MQNGSTLKMAKNPGKTAQQTVKKASQTIKQAPKQAQKTISNPIPRKTVRQGLPVPQQGLDCCVQHAARAILSGGTSSSWRGSCLDSCMPACTCACAAAVACFPSVWNQMIGRLLDQAVLATCKLGSCGSISQL